MVDSKKVIAVVVTYNRKELLKEAIEALLMQSYKNLEILVVDNASTDGTKEMITKNYTEKGIHYYNTNNNIGGAGGFNYGISIAMNLGCDYLWLMDDDTIAENDSLDNLISAASVLNDDFGFLSSYVKYTDGTFCLMNRQRVDRFDWINDCDLLDNGLLRLERATFVSFFVRSEVVKNVGLPIKEFFIWGDDTEYSYRISKKYKSYFVKDSIVVHKMKNNLNTNNKSLLEDESERVERYYYNFRNKFYISKKNGTTDIIKNILQFIQINILLLLKCKKKKWSKIGFIWKGFVSGVFFNPKIEYKYNIKLEG